MPYFLFEREQKKKLFVATLKSGCVLCGTKKGNLEFHHIEHKFFTVRKAIGEHTYKEIYREIKKCVVLCHDCHVWIHTEARRNNGGA